MTEQIISKQCPKCKEIKPLSGFHKKADSRDGLRNTCKTCCLKYKKEYQQTEKGKACNRRHQQSEKGKARSKRYRQSEKGKTAIKRYEQSEKGKDTRKFYQQSEKGKAASIVNNAIRDGKLPRADYLRCHYCSKQAKQYHHWKGYEPEHWLDVVPVCKKCHVLQPSVRV